MNRVDTWLLTLTTSEHAVLVGVIVALSYFFAYHNHLILPLIKTVGMTLFAVGVYVGYRLYVRMEPKDDFE